MVWSFEKTEIPGYPILGPQHAAAFFFTDNAANFHVCEFRYTKPKMADIVCCY